MLDLKRLAVLREVGARGSLAAAAKALSYTPSAVSQQMTALSRDLGVALFERTPRGLRLTDSAHALLAHCEAVFERLAEAQTEHDDASVCDDCDIECVELFDDPFHVVMPRGHPLARREQVELPDLADERVLGAPSSCSPWGADFRRLCRAAGFEPAFESCYRTADFAALQAIVATGRGITLVPELALGSTHPGTVVRRLGGGGLVRHVRLATLAGVTRSPVVCAMVTVLLETAQPQVTAAHTSNLTVS